MTSEQIAAAIKAARRLKGFEARLRARHEREAVLYARLKAA